MSRRTRIRFEAWITRNGGSVFETKNTYEFVRFRGGDGLCIVYRNRHGDVSNFQGAVCRAAWDAFEAGEPFDLKATPVASPKDLWRDRGQAVAVIAEVRSGARPRIDVPDYAAANNLTEDCLVSLGRLHGLAWSPPHLVKETA